MRGILVLLAIVAMGVALAQEAPKDVLDWKGWPVPDVAKVEHPGAKDAPASSPATYADVKGFAERGNVLLDGLAALDLSGYRRGYFEGGDPAKYTIGPCMAKLIRDPKSAQALQFMNDNRTYQEQYHFGCVGWSRFYPLFTDALTPDLRTKFGAAAAKYGSYLSPRGTENHKTMWMTSSNVLPAYIEGNRFGQRGKDEALKQGKQQLREYVKGLYAAGQGEWDSSTYLMFDVNGMLNVYDFSKDEECRLLAKAALDWYAAGYALKYRDGVYTAPNQRGFASGPVKKIADNTGWLWWGSHKEVTPEIARGFLYAVHPLTSAWRPNAVISNLAQRRLPAVPFESRNTKPNYWYGQGIPPVANNMQETVYVARTYTMGSLWKGGGGQMTRFQMVMDGPHGGIVFTGGHPTDYKYEDGNGKYDENALADGTFVCMSKIPAADPLPYVFLSLPEEATTPEPKGKWLVMQAGDTFLAVYPLGTAKVGLSDLSPAQVKANADAVAKGEAPKNAPFPLLRVEGRDTGYILETSDTGSYNDLAAFAAALREPKFAAPADVTYVNLRGTAIQAKYTGNGRADTQVNGKPLDFATWSIYDSPYLTHKDGVLTVNDGKAGFVVDFTGDLPVYKAWKP